MNPIRWYCDAISDKLGEGGIKNKINRRAYRNKPLTESDDEYNSTMSGVRYVVERTFGAFKRHYGVGKTRFLGIVKVQDWVHCNFDCSQSKKAAAILFPKQQRTKCA